MAGEIHLIDGDALIANFRAKKITEAIPEWQNLSYASKDAVIRYVKKIREMIMAAPVMCAVEVVRCQKCDWYREYGGICVNPKCGKSWYGCPVPPDHYCSYGERWVDDGK